MTLRCCVQKAAEFKAPSAPKAYQAQPSTPSTSSPAEDDDDVVPVQITDRMLSRILIFSGLPIVFGLLLFPFFWWLKVRYSLLLWSGLVWLKPPVSRLLSLAWVTWHAPDAKASGT